MCDFRGPPARFKGQPIEFHGVIDWSWLHNHPEVLDELEYGSYLMATTGSWYAIFDGDKFIDSWDLEYQTVEWDEDPAMPHDHWSDDYRRWWEDLMKDKKHWPERPTAE